jgi:hypothetical protein
VNRKFPFFGSLTCACMISKELCMVVLRYTAIALSTFISAFVPQCQSATTFL